MTTDLNPDRIDCHIHAGLERRESLEEAFVALRRAGVHTVALLDHAELYMGSPPMWADLALTESAERLDEPSLVDLFRKRRRGPEVFYRQARAAIEEHGKDMAVAVAIEVSGSTLGDLDPSWLDGADYIGICTTQPAPGAAWGEHLARLISQADKLRGGRDMGLVLHHPFRWRLLELAAGAGAPIGRAAGFSEQDAAVAAKALADAGGISEINYASYYHFRRMPELLQAAGEAFALLKAEGVKFSLGSDAHWLTSTKFEYHPGEAIEAFGMSVDDLQLPPPLGG